MLTFLDSIDKQLFHLLNSLNSPFFDVVMYWISHKFFWIPVIGIGLIALFWYLNSPKRFFLFIIAFGIGALLSDQVTSTVCKPVFKRLRPCHANLDFPIHQVKDHCGGKYGFMSSHAANFFMAATFLSLFFRKKQASFLFFFAALCVSYSRIYLGVHYPFDVLAGALIGIICGGIAHQVLLALERKFK
jgi:undecaprenyl-diphosphatase